MPLAHFSGAHVVPVGYLRQPPAPSQVPLVPQEAAFRSTHIARGSATPAAIGWQVPGAEASAQLRQAPWQASAQQTPSTQKPLAHSPAPAQVCPFDFGPQLPLTQLCPLAQSASVWQWLTQAAATHWNGEQSRTPGGRQAPMPSQVPAVLSRSPLHEAAAQTVSAAYLEHPPIPSQTPDCPQVDSGLRAHT